MKSYIKDTTDFIKKFEAIDHVIDYSYLFSLNVRSLDTNMPHKEEIETVKQKLINQSHFVWTLRLLLLLVLLWLSSAEAPWEIFEDWRSV